MPLWSMTWMAVSQPRGAALARTTDGPSQLSRPNQPEFVSGGKLSEDVPRKLSLAETDALSMQAIAQITARLPVQSGRLFCWPAERHQAGLCVIADLVPDCNRKLIQALLRFGQQHEIR